jgi:hypothetical protein
LADANRAHDRRWLSTSTTIDGMVAIDGLLDSEAGALVLTALAAAATRAGPDDHRSSGQRRADALVDICNHSLTQGAVPSSGGIRPHLLLTAPVDSIVPAMATGKRQTEVAEAAWTGPIPDETARRLGCDAEVTRVLLDAESLPLDVGRSTRTVPPQIRHALVIRDRGCVAESCDRPPAWTDAHHVVHWAEGGRTAVDNLVLLCRSHHRKVHEGGWQFERVGDRWRLVPPRSVQLTYPRLDPGADEASDHVGDAGGDASEQQLPKPGVEP